MTEFLPEELVEQEPTPAPKIGPVYPSTLYSAIHAVMSEVKRLEKTETNDHAKYKFAPADQFRDFIREKFNKYNLVLSLNEMFASQVSEGMKAGTIKFTYQFVIIHTETGEATIPEARSVFLPYVGSQTAGIASTFALKEWLKNKFLISTGEPDPENKMGEADDRAGGKLSLEESEHALKTLQGELKDATKAKKPTEIEIWWKASSAVLNTLMNEHFAKIKKEMLASWTVAKEAELESMPDAELDRIAQSQEGAVQ